MQYKTTIELITDADDEYEAIDKAGEYLRGSFSTDLPLHVRTHSISTKNYKVLGYAISICFIVFASFLMWFSAGRTYQQIASTQHKPVEIYAVQPPLRTDVSQKAGKEFKRAWDRLYREKILYSADENLLKD